MVAFDIVISFSLNESCSVSAPCRMLTSCATLGAAVCSPQSRANLASGQWTWPPFSNPWIVHVKRAWWERNGMVNLSLPLPALIRKAYFVFFPSITILDRVMDLDIDQSLLGTNDRDESESKRNINGQDIKLPFHFVWLLPKHFWALPFWTKS